MQLSPPLVRLLSVLRGCSVVVCVLFIVTPIVGACNCSMFCCTLLYVHSSIAIILMGKGELIALLSRLAKCLQIRIFAMPVAFYGKYRQIMANGGKYWQILFTWQI